MSVSEDEAGDIELAEEPSTIPESPATPTLERPDRVSCRDWTMRCLCFPLVLIVTLVMALVFVIFAAIPLAIFGLLLVIFYYCCTQEPIPLRVLFRALFDADSDMGNESGGLGNNGASQWTAEDIESSLVRRLCLGKWENCSTEKLGKDLSRHPKHKGNVFWEREGADGETIYYAFSEPLSPTKRVEDASDHESPAPVAYFFRPPDEADRSSSAESQEAGKTELDDDDDECDRIENIEETGPQSDVQEDGKENDDNPGEEHSVDEDDTAKRCGASCDICLLDYEEGDIVAWSTNKKCQHAFHSDCLVDWISRKPTCPSCRRDYRISQAKRSRSEQNTAPATEQDT